MNDARVVRCGQAPCRLEGVIEHLASRYRPLTQNFAQVLSFQQLGDNVRRTIGRAHVMDGNNVGMIECGRRARLLLEPAQPLTIPGQGSGQYLDGDIAF